MLVQMSDKHWKKKKIDNKISSNETNQGILYPGISNALQFLFFTL